MTLRFRAWSVSCVLFAAGCSGAIYGPSGIPTATAGRSGGAGGGNSSGGVGSGSGGGTSGTPLDGGTFYPLSVSSSVAKVKNLLTGLAPTDGEVGAVAANPEALRTLVTGWVNQPEYEQKLLGFFGTAFQQNASAVTDFESQEQYRLFAGSYYANDALMLANHHEMFARTALELIKEGRPFTETYTTTRFMLTPALAGAFAVLDSQLIDDTGKVTYQNQANYPSYGALLETKDGPIPSAQAIDPTSQYYLHFYTPSLPSETPSACTQDPLPYNVASVPYNGISGFEGDFFALFMGRPFEMGYFSGVAAVQPLPVAGVPPDGGILCPPPDTSAESYRDFEHWRMVTIRQPQAGEKTTPFFDVDTIRTGTELVLNVPRVGFFTTPSFLAIWNTNSSNQFRVTMNQTMIVGTNQAFTGTDGTAPLSLAAVDQTHASDTACFQCHQQLDPMRQFFRHDYSLFFHQQTLATADNLVAPQFAWEGVAQKGSSIFDLGRLLSQQPHVAATWVQNLCQWANSAPCNESDPEFQRIVSVFQRSNFNWNAMVIELFSSPLVTQLSPTLSNQAPGEIFGITRQAHLCSLLSDRLRIPDVCGLEPSTNVPGTLAPVKVIASSYPSDVFSRGQVGAVLATDPNLFIRTGLENICVAIANQIVDTGRNYSSAQPAYAIRDFAHNLMGLTSDRSAPMIQLLTAHYSEALTQANVRPTDALRSTFVLACLSPYVAGLGQ